MDGFTAIAEPSRRRIIDRLRTGESDVGELVSELGSTQPLVSKHLRVLREAGVVSVRPAGQRRLYRLTDDPLPDVLTWTAPYAALWTASLDRLAVALDQDADDDTGRHDPRGRRP